MLFSIPRLSDDEADVLASIEDVWQQLRHVGRSRGRWHGLLRRSTQARSVRGSVSIEGYHVSIEDAIAAELGGDPLEAQGPDWAATVCYQRAMTYVLHLATDEHFSFSADLVRHLHYLMMSYDPNKSPGRWRPGVVTVRSAATGEVVYEGAPVEDVPPLMDELADALQGRDRSISGIVHAAMAHLNLVMIHPFKDGNGRMARCLQTLVIARTGTLYPPFSSIEEYLGKNTQAYYEVLAEVGGGAWDPSRAARSWIRFCLVAHYRQAMTVLRRSKAMQDLWDLLEEEVERRGLHERTVLALVDAANGYRVTNGTYRPAAEVSANTASRDLKSLVDAGLLEPHGEKRGRYYGMTPSLRALRDRVVALPTQIEDPFEALRAGRQTKPPEPES